MRDAVRGHRAVKLKTHDADASVLEAIYARGDRPLADVLERAWRGGARFDSWDEKLRRDLWEEAFSHYGVEKGRYLGTIPVTARLPWSHIDVGLEDGFLAKEYRKALQDRLSPPCGKAAGMFVHHTNQKDAAADTRRLVCYDCGVACDMTQMREERIQFLERMGAVDADSIPGVAASKAAKRALPVVQGAGADAGTGTGTGTDTGTDAGAVSQHQNPSKKAKHPQPPAGPPSPRYRLRFEKTGPMALLGHLDLIRELPRVWRRVGVRMAYTKGFHPKPDMMFAPALSLGVMSLDEYVDVRLEEELDAASLDDLIARMNKSTPAGLVFRGAVRLGPEDAGLTKVVSSARYLLAFARSAIAVEAGQSAEEFLEARCRAAMEATSLPIRREIEGIGKMIEVRDYLEGASLAGPEAMAELRRAGLVGDLVAIDVEVAIRGSGAVKSSEIAAVVAGDGKAPPPHRAVRIGLFVRSGGERVGPLDLARARRSSKGAEPAAQATHEAAAT
jgi:radical SAM-linked protein